MLCIMRVFDHDGQPDDLDDIPNDNDDNENDVVRL